MDWSPIKHFLSPVCVSFNHGDDKMRKIVYVDDGQTNREVVSKLLFHKNIDCLPFENPDLLSVENPQGLVLIVSTQMRLL